MASNGTRFLGNRPINVKKVRKKSETEEELLNKEELVRNISENEDDLFPSCIFDDSNKSGKDREAFRTLVESLVQMTTFISRIFLRLVEFQFKVLISAE